MESGAEKLILFYMAVCVCLVGFNIACNYIYLRYKRKIEYKSREIIEAVKGESGDETDGAKGVEISEYNLMAAEKAIDELRLSNPAAADRLCLKLMKSVYEDGGIDRVKNPEVKAYIMYLTEKYRLINKEKNPEFLDKIVELALSEDFFLRENALRVLYSIGDADALVGVLHKLDSEGIYHNDKLLHDGMLEYMGDKAVLWEKIRDEFDYFSTAFQVMFIKYFSFETSLLKEWITGLLCDRTRDAELHFACIRYLKKYPYEKARPVLYEIVKKRKDCLVGYRIAAASALASYPGGETLTLLKDLLKDSNWYVRKNAAGSIVQLENEKPEKLEVSDVKDSYGREALQYLIEKRDL